MIDINTENRLRFSGSGGVLRYYGIQDCPSGKSIDFIISKLRDMNPNLRIEIIDQINKTSIQVKNIQTEQIVEYDTMVNWRKIIKLDKDQIRFMILSKGRKEKHGFVARHKSNNPWPEITQFNLWEDQAVSVKDKVTQEE